MTIFTPNIIITKSSEFIQKFMAGDKLSDISSDAINDTLVFLNKQNRYVYSLEHSNGFGQSDMGITLKILDSDGDFENQFLNETFYEKLMVRKIDDYLKSSLPGREFQNYFQSIIGSNLKIYVTYGIGDNLNNWSDPIVCTLVTADIDVGNTGLRKYTYKFQAIPNNFFNPAPQKDESDPNTNDYLNLAIANISVDVVSNSYKPKEATLNVKNILTKFCSKISHTPLGNVVVLLPDFDKNFEAWSLGVSGTLPTQSSQGAADSDMRLSRSYGKLFKSILSEYVPETTFIKGQELKLTTAKTSVINYLNEQEKKSLDAANKARKELPTRQALTQQTTTGSSRSVDKAIETAKELKYIRSKINQVLEKLDSLSEQDPEYKRYSEEYEKLLRQEKEINQSQKSTQAANDGSEETQEEISKANRSTNFVRSLKNLTNNS